MNLILTRFGSTPFGTFGRLTVQNRTLELFTIEQDWEDNEPYQSCVPLGEYDLLWLPTTTLVPPIFDGHTWYLSGGTVAYEDEVPEATRLKCCFHVGNKLKDIKGCVAPGRKLGVMKGGLWGVSQSSDALYKLYKAIGPSHHKLSIRASRMG